MTQSSRNEPRAAERGYAAAIEIGDRAGVAVASRRSERSAAATRWLALYLRQVAQGPGR